MNTKIELLSNKTLDRFLRNQNVVQAIFHSSCPLGSLAQLNLNSNTVRTKQRNVSPYFSEVIPCCHNFATNQCPLPLPINHQEHFTLWKTKQVECKPQEEGVFHDTVHVPYKLWVFHSWSNLPHPPSIYKQNPSESQTLSTSCWVHRGVSASRSPPQKSGQPVGPHSTKESSLPSCGIPGLYSWKRLQIHEVVGDTFYIFSRTSCRGKTAENK